MKKTIYFLLFFTLTFVSAQNATFVIYNVNMEMDDRIKSNPLVRESVEKSMKNVKTVRFGLICDNELSYFYNLQTLDTEEDVFSYKSTLILTGYLGEIYQEKDTLFSQSALLGNNIFVKKSSRIDWKLEDEIKIIDGYECYKATSEYVVINSIGEFRHPVIAWYCPEIPIPYGPKGYSGLPGLILQLQVRNVTFGAISIDLKSLKKIEMNKKNMKLLSEDEYKKALDKFNNIESKKD